MQNRVHKFRIATGRKRKSYILTVVSPDGEITYQVMTGDEATQPYPVMIGRAQIDLVSAEFDDGPAEVRALRLHLFDAEHVGAEAADTTDPRLLVLFPDVRYYVLGYDPDVYDVETGKVVGSIAD